MRRGGGYFVAAAANQSLRTVLTVAAVLLVAAGTQVIPSLPLRPVPLTSVTAMLPSIPFETRIQANTLRVVEAISEAQPARAELFRSVLRTGRQLLHFDPDQNGGRGAWAELVGSIDERTETVGVLVAGGGAHIESDNFWKYYRRAADLVDESDGRLAIVVWAAGRFPKGWLLGALSHFNASLGEGLALFSHELRAEIARIHGSDNDVRLVVAGHSFGGAVVGTAERYGLDADVVFHIASIGVGKVRDPYDYPDPERPRYSMTAPGDLIGYVQGVPTPPGLGHGPDPDTFRCVTELPTGRFPTDPLAIDEGGRPLGDRAGQIISGVSSHSDVFVRYSDAWWEIYRVFTGVAPASTECPPREDPEQVKVRVLPLVVPRVVTASQCRTNGLQPGRRRGPGLG